MSTLGRQGSVNQGFNTDLGKFYSFGKGIQNKINKSVETYNKEIEEWNKNHPNEQKRMLELFDMEQFLTNEEYRKIWRIKFGKIIVSVFNKIGELLKQIEYKIGD